VSDKHLQCTKVNSELHEVNNQLMLHVNLGMAQHYYNPPALYHFYNYEILRECKQVKALN